MARSYKIVADSSANLKVFDKAPFSMVPMKIICEHGEHVDNMDLDVAAMVADLKTCKGRSSTACPSIGEWLEAFGDAEEVYAFTITSHLSGSCASALEAKKMYLEAHPEREVHVFDTLSTGPEMELLIRRTAELLAADIPFEQIVPAIEDYSHNTHLLFCLKSMNNLVKNGRVSPVLAAATGLLGIHIIGIASPEGELAILHKPRGERRTVEGCYAEMKRNGYKGGRASISHCLNPVAGESLKKLILDEFPQADVTLRVVTGLCCYYAEEGGWLVGFEG